MKDKVAAAAATETGKQLGTFVLGVNIVTLAPKVQVVERYLDIY